MLDRRLQRFNSKPLSLFKLVNEFGRHFDAFDKLLRGELACSRLERLVMDLEVLRLLRLNRTFRLGRNVRDKLDRSNFDSIAVDEPDRSLHVPVDPQFRRRGHRLYPYVRSIDKDQTM